MAQSVKNLPVMWETRVQSLSCGTQMVKHLSTMRETWVQSLGQEDLLEKEMATPSSILAWKIPWTEEPGGLQSMGFPRQEYWSGLPFPSPGDLPDPGLLYWQADSLSLTHQGTPR